MRNSVSFQPREEACPLCLQGPIREDYTHAFDGSTLFYDRCSTCDFVFANPQMTAESMRELYTACDYFGQEGTGGAYARYAAMDAIRFLQSKRRLAIIKRHVLTRSGPPELLDIGCATGFFGHVVEQSGYRYYGIEPVDAVAQMGRTQYGLSIETNSLEEASVEQDHYDVVTLWGTDSHFRSVRESFIKLSKALRPGGLMCLNYQDFNSWLRLIFKGIKTGWNVRYNFSRRSMIYLVEKVLDMEILYHKMEWCTTFPDHILRALRLTPRMDHPFLFLKMRIPALSYRMLIARKR